MELKNYFAQDADGNVLPEAYVYLYNPGTTTLAASLKDKSGAALANPFQADGNGLIQVAAPDGDYDLRVTKGGLDYTMHVQFLDSTQAIETISQEADRAGSEASRAESEANRAEAATDAAFVNAAVYETIADGLTGTTDGDQFQVADGYDLIRYGNDSGSATEVARYPSYAYSKELKTRGDTHAGTGIYKDDFELFDIDAQTAENLTDGADPYSYLNRSKTPDGIQVSLSLSSRTIALSTDAAIGPNRTRIVHKAICSGASNSVGLGLNDGSGRDYIYYDRSNGRFIASSEGGIIYESLPIGAANDIVTFDCLYDPDEGRLAITLRVNGGVPYSFRPAMRAGSFEIILRNSGTITHSLAIEAIGSASYDVAAEVASLRDLQIINSKPLAAAARLLELYRRNSPVYFPNSLIGSHAFYQVSGNYFSNVDIQAPLTGTEPGVVTIYVDIATGSDSNDGSESAPLKSLHYAASLGAGKRLFAQREVFTITTTHLRA